MFDYLRLEVRRTLRDTGFVIGGIAMPVMMYLLLTNLGGGDDGAWKTASMVGMAAYGAVGSALNTGGGVAEDKVTGWLRQLRVTPMTSREVVLGRALTGSVTVLPAIVAVLAAAAWSTAYGWTPGSGPRRPCCCGSARSPSPCWAWATGTG